MDQNSLGDWQAYANDIILTLEQVQGLNRASLGNIIQDRSIQIQNLKCYSHLIIFCLAPRLFHL